MKDITNALLNKRYAACVNIIPRMRSKYVLDGRIVESREVMLLIKTSQDLEAKVYQTIKEMHNYDKDYLKWINESLELEKK